MSRIRRFRADLALPSVFPSLERDAPTRFATGGLDVMRMNRAVLAAFLCSATAPATMCDPTDQMSPFIAGPGTTIRDSDATVSRAMAAPNTLAPEAIQLTDAMVVLLHRQAADTGLIEETIAPAIALPSTSTAPDHEPESGLR